MLRLVAREDKSLALALSSLTHHWMNLVSVQDTPGGKYANVDYQMLPNEQQIGWGLT